MKDNWGNSPNGRSNALILDDTANQIQIQAFSDHLSSSLSLGYVTRIEKADGRKDYRGEGVEARTDGILALRGGQGALVTSYPRPKAVAHISDMSETTNLLSVAHNQHASLAQVAAKHLAQDTTDQTHVADTLKAANEAIAGNGTAHKDANTSNAGFPEFQQPHLVLSSPAGIHSATQGSTHQHSAQNHAITSQEHTSISAGKNLLASAAGAIKLFAYQAGMKLISASADIDIQALKTNINILAKLDITQTADTITIMAQKKLILNGAGSFIDLSKGKIELGSDALNVHAALTTYTPKDFNPTLPHMPAGSAFDEYFHIKDSKTGQAVTNFPYLIKGEDGAELIGKTSEHLGQTAQYGTGAAAGKIHIHYIGDELFNHGWEA